MTGRGILRDNPVAVMLVGLCPAAAVTNRVVDAIWMSVGLVSVLLLTRLSQAILHNLQGQEARPDAAQGGWVSTVILASLFTAAFELVLMAFLPGERAALGIYVPLIAVNCIVLQRFARSARIRETLQDAGGLGLGFSLCLIVISVVREVLGAGTITLFPVGSFGGTLPIGPLSLAPARALAYGGGALLCLGYLAGVARLWQKRRARGEQAPARTEAGGA